jgi:DNA-binding CsgD family transcriptional regulator
VTRRQLQVLHAVLDRPEAEAGVLLGISVQTIKGHLQTLYARVGAYNRAHAVWILYDRLKALEDPERRVGDDRRRS